MSHKHHHPIEEEPIDKLEFFLQHNFKKILIAVAVMILIALLGFMFQKNMKAKEMAKQNKLGEYEVYLLTGRADQNKINEYRSMAEEIGMKDYANYQIARFYIAKKQNDKAIAALNQVSGEFKELADSLKYDLGALKTVPAEYLNNSYLTSLWKYRQIISKKYTQKDIDEFVKLYPKSNLYELLKNWEQL
jgi:predicted negative regulator of RcsB-dependent stress response